MGLAILLLPVMGGSSLVAQRVETIQLLPLTLNLSPGDTQSVRLTLQGSGGSVIPMSEDLGLNAHNDRGSVAAFERHGNVVLITAISPGSTTITFKLGDAQPGQVYVRVRARTGGSRGAMGSSAGQAQSPASAVAELRLPVTALQLVVGERERVRVEALNAHQAIVENAPIRYQVYGGGTITVDSASGTVTAISPGTGSVGVSTAGAPSQLLTVTVVAPELRVEPDTLRVFAANRDSLRLLVPSLGRRYRGAVAWTSGNEALLRVDPASGVVTTGTATGGPVPVHATAAGRDYHGTGIVLEPPPKSGGLEFSIGGRGASVTMPIGQSRTLRVVAVRSPGDTMYSVPMAWSLAQGSGGIVLDSAAKELKANRHGSDTLIGRVLLPLEEQDRTYYWPIRAVGGTIVFSRSRLGIRLGERDSLAVLMLDSIGRPTADSVKVGWAAEPARVLLDRGNGVFEAVGPGRAQVAAKAPWDSVARATIFVPPDLVYSHSARKAAGRADSELRGVDMRTGVTRTLTGPGVQDEDAAISPDGSRIAFVRKSDRGDRDLYVMDADGGNAANIIADSAGAQGPFWSPDGCCLFFVVAGRGESQLFFTRWDGSDTRPFLPSQVSSASVSPDGKYLAFSTFRGGAYALYRVSLTTAGPLAPNGPETPVRVQPDNDITLPQYARATGDLFFIRQNRRGKVSKVLMRLPANASEPVQVSPVELKVLSFGVAPDGYHVMVAAAVPGSTATDQRTALYYLDVRQPYQSPPAPWLDGDGVTFATPGFAP